MAITLKQLAKLCILQKNFHANGDIEYINFYDSLTQELGIKKENIMASSLFDDQPEIPFAFFKAENAIDNNNLIIHVHGGPHVYFDIDNRHAEVAYFLSQGYTVACVNYRGSTSYPEIGGDPEGWKRWEIKSKGKHHIYGPEDVYAVAKFCQQIDRVVFDKIFLRGGSFGSYINSQLLRQVKLGKFENIFSGVHLSGGLNYRSFELT